MTRGRVLTLTLAECAALSEALRYSQQVYGENRGDGRLDPALSRIQRKLGEEPSAD